MKKIEKKQSQIFFLIMILCDSVINFVLSSLQSSRSGTTLFRKRISSHLIAF